MRKTALKRCPICGKDLPQPTTGRSRRTCSDACRQALYASQHPERKRDRTYRRKQRRAEKQVRAYEARFGDLSKIPGGRYPGSLDLRTRLMIHLTQGAPIKTCWSCDKPYIPEGTRTGTCSDRCAARRRAYFKRLERNFYDNPRALPSDVTAAIRQGKRLSFCAHCDDPFVPTQPTRKYCTPQCRKAAWEKREVRRKPSAKQQPVMAICENCGESFEKVHPKKRFCTRRCKRQAHHRRDYPPVIRLCAECGTPFELNRVFRVVHRHCSRECLVRGIDRGMRPSAMGWWRKCILCGTEYKPHQRVYDTRIYCSTSCGDGMRNLVHYDLDKLFGKTTHP